MQPLPEGFLSHGIDISHHQGEVDWELFFDEMDSTISFVYCKVTEGTHFVDDRWKENNAVLSQHRMKHGGYHFFTPDVSAKKQAAHFLKHYAPNNCGMPPVLDAEIEGKTQQSLIDGMHEWLRIVELETGVRPVIYTSYSLFRDRMKGKFPNHQFWIASYHSDDSRVQDSEVIHWQYSDRGEIPGINGYVDLNFSKQAFRPRIEMAQ